MRAGPQTACTVTFVILWVIAGRPKQAIHAIIISSHVDSVAAGLVHQRHQEVRQYVPTHLLEDFVPTTRIACRALVATVPAVEFVSKMLSTTIRTYSESFVHILQILDRGRLRPTLLHVCMHVPISFMNTMHLYIQRRSGLRMRRDWLRV